MIDWIALGEWARDPQGVLAISIGVSVFVALLLLILSYRASVRSAKLASPMAQRLDTLGERVAALSDSHQRLAGGLSQVSETQNVSQTQLLTAFERRLEEMTRSMGDTLHGTATRTARSLGDLERRLETIDTAQSNIEKLSSDVLGLQDILSNKQARGAFGETQLNDIVAMALPSGSYRFQATLSNGRRADCLIDLPNPPGPLVIDSKFPLEPYEALRNASNEAEETAARRAMRNAVRAHIKAISQRYIIPGETGDGAIMFVPSEAVYAELHASFGGVVREGFAAQVWTVSPTTCMAVLTTLRTVLKDVHLREEAGLVRRELGLLLEDLRRMGERMDRLDGHFGKAVQDLADLRLSTDKATSRAGRLDGMDFGTASDEKPISPVQIVRQGD